jgi:hypothetical protein
MKIEIALILFLISAPAITCEMDLDPWPTCDESNQVEITNVALYAAGILKLKKTWYSCGVLMKENERVNEAINISVAVDDSMRSLGATFTPWGVLGVMANESGFDRCAIGRHPRKWAYENGLLERRKTTISDTEKNVVNLIESESARNQFSNTGFDLGLCQVLSKFYDGNSSELLTISPGVRICIVEMISRSATIPWLYWRGSATEWYRDKVRNWARAMGAPVSELGRI